MQHLLHQHEIDDHNKKRRNGHDRTVKKADQIGSDRILLINLVQLYTNSCHCLSLSA